MTALSDPYTYQMVQANHTEQMEDASVVEPGITDMPAANGNAVKVNGTGSAKKSRKTKKDDKNEDLMAALLDRRSYFANLEKSQEKSITTNESEIIDVPVDNELTKSTEEAKAPKKSSKSKREAENREDFMAALSDRRSYFAGQVKEAQQKKAMGIVEPAIQNGSGPNTAKKRIKSRKKETQNVCIII